MPIVIGLLGFVAFSSMGVPGCNDINTVGTGVCIACHDGRTATQQLDFLVSEHKNIECEACHGGGYLHVRNGGRGGLFIKNPANGPFDDSYAACVDCHGDAVNGFLASDHAASKSVRCSDCHDVHKLGGMKRNPLNNDICLRCHARTGFTSDAIVQAHTHHSVDPAGTGASRCVSCHLPPLARANQPNVPHSHSLMPIPPIRSNQAAELGVRPVPPNSCSGILGCHDGAVVTAPVFDVDNLLLNQMVVQPFYDLIGKTP